MTTLQEQIQKMTKPQAGLRYFVITLTATDNGHIQWETQSCFAGFTETTPRREIRVASEIFPDKMIAIWKEWKQPYVVVSSRPQLSVFLLLGGNALVEIGLAEAHFEFLSNGIEVTPDGFCSSIEVSRVPPTEKQRAPTPKARMQVLKRDKHRCVICGRRPVDYVDVELNIHHIRPWAEGGLTKRNNMITLCRTCHTGLDPHFDWELFGLIPDGQDDDLASSEEMTSELLNGVKRYRKKVQLLIQGEKNRTANKRVETTSGPGRAT